MTPIVFILVAVAVAVALILGARLYFDRVERRKAELRIGTEVLASRSWKEGLDLLARALQGEGGASETLLSDKGVPLPERLLTGDGKRTLLVYKHGTTYRIGPPAIADAQRRQAEVEADALCLATLGTLEPAAVAQSERDGVRLLGGDSLWPLVERHIDERVRQEVGREASESLVRPRALATTAAALLGAAIVVMNLPDGGSIGAETAGSTMIVPSPSAPRPDAASAPSSDEAAVAASEDARRAALVSSLIDLRGVEAAQWSSNTTIVIDLLPGHGADGVFEAACGLAPKYPELRDIRLQLESKDPAEGVRWRRCG